MKVIWESLPPQEEVSTRVLTVEAARFDGPLHAHNALELTYIAAGSGMRFLGDSVEAFGPGDLVLVAPRAPHAWQSHGSSGGHASALVLQMALCEDFLRLPEWQRWVEPWLTHGAAGWVISGELGARIRNDLISLDRAEPLIRLGRALSLLGGVGAALQTPCTDIRAVGRLVSSDGAGNSDRQKRVDRLLLFIRRHLHRPIQAQEAARRLHVTPGAFSRAFKRLIGKSFSQYVNDLRVAEACLELGRSDRPVAQIATQCGFGTLSNFNRQFRARLGVTPRAYRSGSARK